jgi:hypothetical protein
MPFVDLAPPSWEAVPDDVPTTLYAPEEVVGGGAVTDVSKTLYAPEEVVGGGAVTDVPKPLYAPEVVAADTVVTLVDAISAVGDEVWIVL